MDVHGVWVDVTAGCHYASAFAPHQLTCTSLRSSQTVQRTVLCMGRKQEAVENVPVGNTVRSY